MVTDDCSPEPTSSIRGLRLMEGTLSALYQEHFAWMSTASSKKEMANKQSDETKDNQVWDICTGCSKQ